MHFDVQWHANLWTSVQTFVQNVIVKPNIRLVKMRANCEDAICRICRPATDEVRVEFMTVTFLGARNLSLVHQHTSLWSHAKFNDSRLIVMAFNFVLPGQPVALPRGPALKLGTGLYNRDGQVRASVLGKPQQDGSASWFLFHNESSSEYNHVTQTLSIPRVRPNPPSPDSVVLGSVTRLSPLQATISILVVDGVPLPAGEEFTGVIRTQDVRATEKDKIKIVDCFRGGDIVKGLVVWLFPAHSFVNAWLCNRSR